MGDDVDLAARSLILRNDTHFNSLTERLREPRTRRVIEPIIIGAGVFPNDISEDDVKFAVDLGLLKKEDPYDGSSLMVSNPIYGELIVRALTRKLQNKIPAAISGKWTDGSGIDMDGLLREFRFYWRMNADITEKSIAKADDLDFQEKERIDWVLSTPELAGKYNVQDDIISITKVKRTGCAAEDIPHNALNAFLQRAVNGGADFVQMECATGRTMADICVIYKGIYYPIEIKINGSEALETGKNQRAGNMDKCGSSVGWLIIFDMDFKKLWDDKIFWHNQQFSGKTINVVGC
ncbi:MAG: hypothetical protein LBQ12_00140 [Deltaproteobacteria bacterium]|jgi:hypothetical protein|nr:hypothetical protein [Deltaproteobacteria bacterium]